MKAIPDRAIIDKILLANDKMYRIGIFRLFDLYYNYLTEDQQKWLLRVLVAPEDKQINNKLNSNFVQAYNIGIFKEQKGFVYYRDGKFGVMKSTASNRKKIKEMFGLE